jgi:transcription initiation factor TFIIB
MRASSLAESGGESRVMKDQEVTRCPECGNVKLIRDFEAGELVCELCGFVVSSTVLNYGPERRAFDLEQIEERTRVGAPMTWAIHDKGLSTNIDWSGLDSYGRRLNPDQRAQMYRLRKWNRRSKITGASDRSLAFALSEMTKVTYKLGLPKNVLETASLIYRQAVKERLIRGRSIQGVATASVYMACRKCGVIRSLEEVGRAAHISKKESGRNYRFLIKRMDTKVPSVAPCNYVSKFMSQLGLSGNAEVMAMKILDQAIRLRLTGGRGPAGIAAAVTYIACVLTGEQRTQGEIAKEARVTEVTIRNRYKELTQRFNFEVKI